MGWRSRYEPGDPVVAVKNIGAKGIWKPSYVVPRGTSGVVTTVRERGFFYDVPFHVPGRNVRGVRADEIAKWRHWVDGM